MNDDAVVEHVLREVLDDEVVQAYTHNKVCRLLELPEDFGSRDEHEEDPKYDEYWKQYSIGVAVVLQKLIERVRTKVYDGTLPE